MDAIRSWTRRMWACPSRYLVLRTGASRVNTECTIWKGINSMASAVTIQRKPPRRESPIDQAGEYFWSTAKTNSANEPV